MSIRWGRWLAVAGVVVIAALLAFPLRGIVNELIVVPIAYIFWLLGLLYISTHQVIWWIVILLLVLFILGKSLLPELKLPRKRVTPTRRERGKVESLATSLQKSKKGIYFKWLVANRLGKLTHEILLQRGNGKPRSVFAPLTGEGLEPTLEMQQYLEKGLHGSFAEFPNTGNRYFAPPSKTLLDHDVAEVIEFLESSIESKDKPLRP
jgi:hypothetical protein